LTAALDEVFSGRRAFEDALREHQDARDARTRPMFDFTLQFATFDPPTDDDVALFEAIASDPAASDDFASVMAGTMPVEAFFDEANLGRLLGAPAA
jgi:hypothetical protein